MILSVLQRINRILRLLRILVDLIIQLLKGLALPLVDVIVLYLLLVEDAADAVGAAVAQRLLDHLQVTVLAAGVLHQLFAQVGCMLAVHERWIVLGFWLTGSVDLLLGIVRLVLVDDVI